MGSQALERVQFREGQYLTADDLNQEQLYRISQWRRHRASSHTWGIVRGLTLNLTRDQGLEITPGVAVDGFGRELIVSQTLLIEKTTLDNVRSDDSAIDVWLLYARVPEVVGQSGRWDCGPGQHNRWCEETRVRLTATNNETKINPLEPPDVLDADLNSMPYGDLPDEDTQEWPVYLGRVNDKNSSYELDNEASLVYTGLVGEDIVSASGLTHVQLARKRGTRQQFVVATRQDKTQAFEDQLVIGSNGEAEIGGDLIVDQLLIGSIKTEEHNNTSSPSNLIPEQENQYNSLEWTPLAETPKQALPWHVYHTNVKAPNTEQVLARQLRIELFNPGDKGDGSQHRFAIGHWNKKNFESSLSVDANCTVYIKDLKVAGKIIEGPLPPDLGDARFRKALIQLWHSGVVTGSNALAELEATFENVLTPIKPGDNLKYEIKLKNPNEIELTNILVHVEVFFSDSSESEKFPTNPLKAGESRTIERVLQPSSPWPLGDLTLVMIAWGFINEFVAVNTYAQTTVNVQN
jgi:hypothetical protein